MSPTPGRGGAQLLRTTEEEAEHEAGQIHRMTCPLAGWAEGPRTRKAVGMHGVQETIRSIGPIYGGYGQKSGCGREWELTDKVKMSGVRPTNSSNAFFSLTASLQRDRQNCCQP